MSDFNQQIIEEFRSNGGVVGGMFEGANLLLLHTTGARSGAARVNPLAYQDLGGAVAVFGSAAGAPKHPDWYHNVQANEAVRVELGSETFAATARIATGAERDRIWSAQKSNVPTFAEYEAKTSREIPVVVLERTP
jgi:deazaflavin-dependent oxidoreductase (nitroreductase family)